MISLSFLLISLSSLAGVLSAPSSISNALERRQTSISPGSGTNNGFYYNFWYEGPATASGEPTEKPPIVELQPSGRYSVAWSGNSSRFLVGKGWRPGSARTISYAGTFAPLSGTAYLSIYGWTTSPLVEYYILESSTSFSPASDSTYKLRGSLTSDGNEYDIYYRMPPNSGKEPSPWNGQYWSIRRGAEGRTGKVGGSVTTGNHFEAWKAVGLELGSFDYQIVSTEITGAGSGSAEITVA